MSKLQQNLIDNKLCEFDDYEIHPVHYDVESNSCEPIFPWPDDLNDPEITMWSVYGHFPTGGVQCIADCYSFEVADTLYQELMNTVPLKDKQFDRDKNTVAIGLIWSMQDIFDVADTMKVEVNNIQAGEILDNILHRHDANDGVTWDTIEIHIEEYLRDK